MTAATASWRRHGIALAVVTVALLLIFYADVVQLVSFWWTSESYGHCLFIPLICAWLVWQRRCELAQLDPVGWWPGLIVVTAGGMAWLMGEAGSVTFARQFGLVLMLAGAVIATLGSAVARGLMFPLAYAFFMVPFGEGLEAPLQAVTVQIVMPLLALAGVPATSDGVMIHAGPYYFEVAEACSGARFVVAMLAVAALVCATCYSSWRRRAAFLALAIVVPILANGIRAFATIYGAQIFGIEMASGFDHIVFGWMFFAVVMVAVLAIGWRWFDRAPDAPTFDADGLRRPRRGRLAPVVAASLAVATAALFPAWNALATARAAPLPARIDLPDLTGWRRAAIETRTPWQPRHPGADHCLYGRYVDAAGDTVDMAVAVYGRQGRDREIVGFGVGALPAGSPWLRVADLPPIGGGAAMRITAPGPVERVVVTWYRIGDIMTADQKRVKIETMIARLQGRPAVAVAIHLSAVVRPGRDPRGTIERFLTALGPLEHIGTR